MVPILARDIFPFEMGTGRELSFVRARAIGLQPNIFIGWKSEWIFTWQVWIMMLANLVMKCFVEGRHGGMCTMGNFGLQHGFLTSRSLWPIIHKLLYPLIQ